MTLHSLALIALLATQSTEDAERVPTPAEVATKAWSDGLAQQLRASSSARERALSARMIFEDPKGGGKALRAAAQAAPTDPLVQFLWATIGKTFSGCDDASPCPEQTMAWARVEPDNGLAWLPPFEELAKSGDDKAIDEAINQMAHATSYDDHFVDGWLAFRQAIAARPMPEQVAKQTVQGAGFNSGGDTRQEAADVIAMAYAAALPVTLVSLSRSCRRESHPQVAVARFENCARIGRNIVHSDSSVMMKMFGLSLVRVSGLGNDADRETRRTLYWRQNAAVQAMNRFGDTGAYFADLASTRSEVRAQELLMARHGIALDPPADWKPQGQ